jgi:hypothetical protein
MFTITDDDRQSAQALLDAYSGRAGLLARGIIYGIAKYDSEQDPILVGLIADRMLVELATTAIEMPTRLVDRADNALAWTLNPLVPDHIAAVFGAQVLQTIKTFRSSHYHTDDPYKGIKQRQSFKDYRARYRKVLPAGLRL